MGTRFSNFSKWFVPQRNKAHIAVFILSIFMIPGALTALQPIDMESYEMESPELTAQTIINEEFANSEIILGFVISARDPRMFLIWIVGPLSNQCLMEHRITLRCPEYTKWLKLASLGKASLHQKVEF